MNVQKIEDDRHATRWQRKYAGLCKSIVLICNLGIKDSRRCEGVPRLVLVSAALIDTSRRADLEHLFNLLIRESRLRYRGLGLCIYFWKFVVKYRRSTLR